MTKAIGRRGAHAELGEALLWGVAVASGGFGSLREAAVLRAVVFGFGGGFKDGRWVNGPAAVFGGFGWNAEGGKCWTENWDQRTGYVCAEGRTDCEGAGVWHPISCNVV